MILKKILLDKLSFALMALAFTFCQNSLFAQCNSFLFPGNIFYETFQDTMTCMVQTGDTPWEYGNPNSAPIGIATGDAATATDNGIIGIALNARTYIVMDGSDNTHGESSTLTSPDFHRTPLWSSSESILEYSFYSQNSVDAAYNKLLVELYNGTSWIPIDSNFHNQAGWQTACYNLTTGGLIPNGVTISQVRFTVTGDNSLGGSTANHDILIDNIIVREMSCEANISVSAGATGPTTASVSAAVQDHSLGAIISVTPVSTGATGGGSASGSNPNYPYQGSGYGASFSGLTPGGVYLGDIGTTCPSGCSTNGSSAGTNGGSGSVGGCIWLGFGCGGAGSGGSGSALFQMPFPNCWGPLPQGDSPSDPIPINSSNFAHRTHTDSCYTQHNNSLHSHPDIWYQLILDDCADSLHINLNQEEDFWGWPSWSADIVFHIMDNQSNVLISNLRYYSDALNIAGVNSGDSIFIVVEARSPYPQISSPWGGPPTGITGNWFDLTVSYSTTSPPDPSFSYFNATYCADNNNILPNISGTSGGNFNSTANVNNTTGELVLDNNNVGIHDIIYTVTSSGIPTCLAKDTFNISISDINAGIASSADIQCFGAANGTATVTSSNGIPGYSYLWSNNQTNAIATGLSPGNYQVSITDSIGCMDSTSVQISQPVSALSSVISNSSHVSCFGGANGSLEIASSGGSSGYTYLWSNTETTNIVNNLSSGAYSVTITDNNGCSEIVLDTISEPTILQVLIDSIQQISCFGLSDASIYASAIGGTGTYTYLWNDNTTNATISNLPASVYVITVTDINSCTATTSTTIIEPNLLAATLDSLTHVSCFGDSSAYVSILATGGTGAYTYFWNNGATSSVLNNLPAGNYNLTLSDVNNCSQNYNYTISEPTALAGSIDSLTHVSCFGDSSAYASILATGGTGAYTYFWNNGATSSVLNNLPAGNYSLTLSDVNNCSQQYNYTISEPTTLAASIDSLTHVSCFGDSTGSIIINHTGGTTPYQYLWSNGQTGAFANNLTAGAYSITLTDSLGCTHVSSTNITEALQLVLLDSSANNTCFGDSTGSIYIQPTGGTAAYSFLWNNGATNSNLNNLPVGIYVITLSDANGCTENSSISISEPTSLAASIQDNGNAT